MGSNKWKKRLGKAAALAAGIYGATRFGKARKKKALNAITAGDIVRSNYQIPDTDMGAISPESHYDALQDKSFYAAAKGGRIGAKKGGLIKGKPKLAKRGWK